MEKDRLRLDYMHMCVFYSDAYQVKKKERKKLDRREKRKWGDEAEHIEMGRKVGKR